MKRILVLALSAQLLAPISWAQTTTATKTVSKTISGNALTEDLTVPSGKALTVATGGTLTVPAAALPIAATSGLQAALDAKAATSSLATVATSGLASDLTGTLADARLSANVPLLSASNTFTGATQTAPAWLLPTFTASTIATNQTGLGWDENGRVTIQTPIGALQFYQTGTPAVPVIYWPGKIVSDTIEANAIAGGIPADSITALNGTEAINIGIIARSLMSPMSEWIGLQDYAGANGVPYVSDAQGTSGSLEATDGVYFPQAVVSGQSTVTSIYTGRYRTATQVRSDLGLGGAALLNTGTAAGTVAAGDDSRITGALSAATAATTYQPRAATRLITTSGAVLATDAVVICTGAGGITLTLPAANAATPRPLQLEIINRTSGTVTLARSGSDLFEGETDALITSGSSWSITSDASANWYLY